MRSFGRVLDGEVQPDLGALTGSRADLGRATVALHAVDDAVSYAVAVRWGLLDHEAAYAAMARAHNPFGDGKSAGRICDLLAG